MAKLSKQLEVTVEDLEKPDGRLTVWANVTWPDGSYVGCRGEDAATALNAVFSVITRSLNREYKDACSKEEIRNSHEENADSGQCEVCES